MSDTQGTFEEQPLRKSQIYRGPQTPATEAYVPLPVFVVETIALVASIPLLGLKGFLLLPLHLIAVSKTSDNPYWVRDLWADINNRWFAGNKGEYGKTTISFIPQPPLTHKTRN